MVNYYFGLGMLMLLALIGVYLVNKYGQSVILAYIVVGVLIGPNLAFEFMGVEYHGVISDQEMIHQLLELGLIFLFFFVGLEFSITRLKETKKVATAIAVTHVGMNLFIGFAIATIFNWDLFGSIFLAGVIGVSSAAVATKTLKDLGRLSGSEVKFLLTSIIVEDFILIIMIALASGSAMRGGDLDTWAIVRLIASVCFLYSIFLLLGFIIIPRLYHYLEKMDSNELFVLFAMAVIFLAAALAQMLQIPRPLGAFFMGMTFAETRFSKRLLKELGSIRKGFTAIFFMAFGMMIVFNQNVIFIVTQMLILTVPLILCNHFFIMSSVNYLLGFKPRQALTIGACLAGRGEDTLLYASVGANLQKIGSTEYVFSQATRDTLFSFAGIYCFIMATLAPINVKNLDKIVKALKRITPKKWVFGGTLVHKTLKIRMFSVGGPFTKVDRRLLTVFAAYVVMLFGVILTRDILFFIIFAVGGVVVLHLMYNAWEAYLSPTIDLDLFEDMHLLFKDKKDIDRFIVGTVMKLVAAPFICSLLWGIAQMIGIHSEVYPWWIAPAGALIVIGAIAMGCEKVHDHTMVRPAVVRKEHMIKGYFENRDEEFKGKKHPQKDVREPHKDRAKGPFKPMRYDQLISTKRYESRFDELDKMEKRLGRAGRKGKGPSKKR